jgi:hypothetical protein
MGPQHRAMQQHPRHRVTHAPCYSPSPALWGPHRTAVRGRSQDHSVILWHEVVQDGAPPVYEKKAQVLRLPPAFFLAREILSIRCAICAPVLFSVLRV